MKRVSGIRHIQVETVLVHGPETAQAIGQASSTRRQAYNLAVEHCLAHPNAPYNQVQALLTQQRKEDPEHWAHSKLALQRPGLKQGYNSVKAFHKADATVLRECLREVRYREKNHPETGRAKPPRHGNRPERDPDSKKLFLKRGRKPEYLRVDEAGAISLIPDQNGKTARAITVCGMTLRLTKPVPADTDIRAVTLVEARPARLKRRAKRNGEKPRHNRDLAEKRYEVRIHRRLPDPKPTDTLETLGLDPGIARLITDSDGDVHQMDQTAQERLEQLGESKDIKQNAIARLNKIHPGQPGSRQIRKLQKEIRALNSKIEGIRNNQECRIARTIANKAARKKGQAPRNVACEKTQIKNMVRSARGTMENPGRNVAQKSGLNRSIHRCRWGRVKTRIANACERQGTAYFEVRAANSSLRCSRCGHTSRENRKSQAEFQCTRCGHQDNADRNAAVNHAKAANPQLYRYLTRWMKRKRLPKRKPWGRGEWSPQRPRTRVHRSAVLYEGKPSRGCDRKIARASGTASGPGGDIPTGEIPARTASQRVVPGGTTNPSAPPSGALRGTVQKTSRS